MRQRLAFSLILAASALALIAFAVSRSLMARAPEKVAQIRIYDSALNKIVEVPTIVKSGKEWRKILTRFQYYVTREKGTELAFTGKYDHFFKKGIYKCVCCKTDLFSSKTKYDSGTGWPSFWAPVSKLNVRYVEDDSLGVHRIEVVCARCGAHLGHVFDDGPPPTHKRFCMNSAALLFVESKQSRK